MAKKKNHDSVTEAALSVVKTEQMEEQLAVAEQDKKEKTIAQIYKMMGRIEAAGLFEKVAVTSTFVWMKQVKKSQLYKKIPEIGSWKIFCNTMGYNRRYVDEQLQNLDAFGEKLLEVYRQFSLSHKDLRKLRKSVSDGEMIVDSETIEINGEKIPFTPDYSEDMQAAIESLLDEKDRQLENKDATLKAKDRVLEAKEKIINKQEKELHKLTRQVKARGFEPGEENFIRDMENLKTMLVGVELKMDVRNMPKDMTPLMRAAYIETLGHFKRIMIAYYDEATNHYGIADDDDWVPPYEREEKIEE
jgi:ribosome-associated translation inhibitor RaiA